MACVWAWLLWFRVVTFDLWILQGSPGEAGVPGFRGTKVSMDDVYNLTLHIHLHLHSGHLADSFIQSHLQIHEEWFLSLGPHYLSLSTRGRLETRESSALLAHRWETDTLIIKVETFNSSIYCNSHMHSMLRDIDVTLILIILRVTVNEYKRIIFWAMQAELQWLKFTSKGRYRATNQVLAVSMPLQKCRHLHLIP